MSFDDFFYNLRQVGLKIFKTVHATSLEHEVLCLLMLLKVKNINFTY